MNYESSKPRNIVQHFSDFCISKYILSKHENKSLIKK